MKLPAITDQSTPAELMDAIGTYIDTAEKLITEGNEPQLGGLDTLVDALCARVQSLSANEGKAFSDVLETLRSRLDSLQNDMVAARARAKEEIGALNQRAKAVRAYSKEKKE
jgi:hypothetical protein